jgi:DNA polymerase-1
MIKAHQLLSKHPEFGHMLLQIHDELIFESPDEHIYELSKKVKKIMEHVMSLKVPLSVEISIGKNWGEC